MMKVHPRWCLRCLRSMIIQTPMWVFPKIPGVPQNGFVFYNGKLLLKMGWFGGTVPPFSETHHVLRQATRHVHCQLHYWPSTPHNLLDFPRPLVDSNSDFHLNRPQLFSEANRMHTRMTQYGEKNHVIYIYIYNIHFKICPKYHPDAPCMDLFTLHSAKDDHIQGEM